jgi:hypothetical protein
LTWLTACLLDDKEKPCGERSRTILPGQDFDIPFGRNLPDWELEIREAV